MSLGRGKECIQYLSSEETPASITELQEPELTAVSTVVGGSWHSCCHQLQGPLKQARSCLQRISFILLIDCTQEESTLLRKTHLSRISFSLLIDCTHVGSTPHRTWHISKPWPFYGKCPLGLTWFIRNTYKTTSTDCMTRSPQDSVDKIEGQDLEEKTTLLWHERS